MSRGIPGPEVLPSEDIGQDRTEKRRKQQQQQHQAKARNRGLWLGGCACRRKVIASAIDERFAFCDGDNAADNTDASIRRRRQFIGAIRTRERLR